MKNTNKEQQKIKKQSLFNCLYEEVVRGSAVGEDDSKYLLKEQQIITFLNVPWELEKVLYLGYLVCLDAFLFIFTFLPIRTVCALTKMLCWFFRKILFLQTQSIDKGLICDLFRLVIMSVCLVILSWVNISMLYHLIRGQSVIKLYFIYNVLEIVDYLCLSFGNDVMDALFWLTIRNKQRKREHLSLLWHLVLACIYTLIHSMCFLVQAICLSVAINSHNKSLLVVMISNQYMEIKSYLFKKFDRINNYQVVARDIRERFQYTVIIVVVFMRNMSQLDWQTSHMYDILPDIALIICSEVTIDWIKHAFVTRFNGISAASYTDYRFQLYDDLLNPALYKQTFSNRMDLMARKILFIPMPLACLTITVLIEVIPEDLELGMIHYIKYGGATMLILFIVKVINMGLILHNAERLRAKCPQYKTPRIPPIRNVNSSVQIRLPTPPPEEDEDEVEEDPLKRPASDSVFTEQHKILQTVSEISEDIMEKRQLTASVSAPDLSIANSLDSSPESFYTPHKHSSDPPPLRPEISFQIASPSFNTTPTDNKSRDFPSRALSSGNVSSCNVSSRESSSRESTLLSGDSVSGMNESRDILSSPLSRGTSEQPRKSCGCHCKCSQESYTPRIPSSPNIAAPSPQNVESDTENKPPTYITESMRNIDFKEFNDHGLRKRTVDGVVVED